MRDILHIVLFVLIIGSIQLGYSSFVYAEDDAESNEQVSPNSDTEDTNEDQKNKTIEGEEEEEEPDCEE